MPGAGAAAGASVEVLEQPVRNIGSDIAARVAEEAFTKVLRENLLFFILVLLLISYMRACMAFSISSGVTVGSKRATTLPFLSTRNLVKFHLMLGLEA